jgi:EAL domain-containing protein (putative c-di-GMP-specific phosphodiesterase class I)
VLAEGIETKAHFDFLKKEGCDEAQGYFLGRPMPVGLIFPQAA